MNDLFTLVIAAAGLALSIFSLWLQYRVSPPLVALQNTINAERCIFLTREKLPAGLKNRFPEYSASFPGCIVFSLIWGNSGDRVGLVDVRAITASDAEGKPESLTPEASYYNFVVVPGQSVVTQEVVLWNISEQQPLIDIRVDYAWGSPDRQTGRFKEERKDIAKVSLRVLTGRA